VAKRPRYIRRKAESAPQDTSDANKFNDLGFSNSTVSNRKRFINKDGSFNVVREIRGIREWHIYQWLVLMSWARFFAVTLVFYVVLNSFFASLYLINGIEYLSGAGEDGLPPFGTAFFFSVQTLTTVGYGSVSPIGLGANTIAAMGALTGLLAFALITGLLFARFSKPSASILFSNQAIVAPYKDGKGLMFRLANQRKSMLTNLHAEVTASWIGVDEQGRSKRQYTPLKLERTSLTMLPLSWTVVHPIDEESPFYDSSEQSIQAKDLEVIIILEGYDDTFANIIRTHYSYKYDEIIWNVKFNPIFHFDKEGYTVLKLNEISNYSEA